jgi:hypothetical protein
MIRRPLRPTFDSADQKNLIEALRDARNWVIKYASAEKYGSPKHVKCGAVTQTIDDLAGELTGDRTLFHLKAHGGARWTPPK